MNASRVADENPVDLLHLMPAFSNSVPSGRIAVVLQSRSRYSYLSVFLVILLCPPGILVNGDDIVSIQLWNDVETKPDKEVQ